MQMYNPDIDSLRQQYHTQKEETLEDAVELIRLQKQALEKQLIAAETALKEQTEHAEALKEQIDSLKAQLSEARAETEKITASEQKNMEVISALQNEIKNLRNGSETEKEKAKNLQNAVNDLKADLQKERAEHADKGKEIDALRNDIGQKQREIDRLRQEAEETAKKVYTEMYGQQQAIDDLTQRNTQLQSELAAANATVENLQHDLAATKTNINLEQLKGKYDSRKETR